ncbi:MAG: hypothetical protein HY923_07410 [Elusimicrobia bacterium]|nr:hypothetical protein [Elusimicrobiota bacterium]
MIIHSTTPGALSIGDSVEFIQFKDLGVLRIARILSALQGFRASYHVWGETMIEAALTRRQAKFMTSYLEWTGWSWPRRGTTGRSSSA